MARRPEAQVDSEKNGISPGRMEPMNFLLSRGVFWSVFRIQICLSRNKCFHRPAVGPFQRYAIQLNPHLFRQFFKSLGIKMTAQITPSGRIFWNIGLLCVSSYCICYRPTLIGPDICMQSPVMIESSHTYKKCGKSKHSQNFFHADNLISNRSG